MSTEIEEAKTRLRIAVARGELGDRRRDVHFVLDYLDALEADEWEWGVLYEGVYTAAHSVHMARKWANEDDVTVLVKRRPAGPWVFA